jgi:hypothetical protein
VVDRDGLARFAQPLIPCGRPEIRQKNHSGTLPIDWACLFLGLI